MLLALNIGNTNITFGSFASDGRLAFVSRLYADPALSSDEICYKIINMLDLYGASPLDIEGVILGSVVPSITGRMREALRKMTQAPVLEVGPGLRSGVRIRMDNPAQLGAELLCATVGALRRHTPPLLVIHMDTAATMLAVDAEGSLVGGVILPGPQVSLRALVENTAQLPRLNCTRRPANCWVPTRPIACTAARCLAPPRCWTQWWEKSARRSMRRKPLSLRPAPCPRASATPAKRRSSTGKPWFWKVSTKSGGKAGTASAEVFNNSVENAAPWRSFRREACVSRPRSCLWDGVFGLLQLLFSFR